MFLYLTDEEPAVEITEINTFGKDKDNMPVSYGIQLGESCLIKLSNSTVNVVVGGYEF
jgi:hypothetical protein